MHVLLASAGRGLAVLGSSQLLLYTELQEQSSPKSSPAPLPVGMSDTGTILESRDSWQTLFLENIHCKPLSKLNQVFQH